MAVVLLLGFAFVGALGAAPAAHALTYDNIFSPVVITLSNGNIVCNGANSGSLLDGSWSSGTGTCTVSSLGISLFVGPFEVGAGVTIQETGAVVALILEPGVALANNGTITLAGSEYGVESYGLIINRGTLNATGASTAGIYQDSGHINNTGTLVARGYDGLEVFGSSIFNNLGTLNATGTGSSSDGVDNQNTLNNYGVINATGSTWGFYNGWFLINQGKIFATGFTNEVTVFNDVSAAINSTASYTAILNNGNIWDGGSLNGNATAGSGARGIDNANFLYEYCSPPITSSQKGSTLTFPNGNIASYACAPRTFSESGLPSGASWGVNGNWAVGSFRLSTTGNSVVSPQAGGEVGFAYTPLVRYSGEVYQCGFGCGGIAYVVSAVSFSASYVLLAPALVVSPSDGLAGSAVDLAGTGFSPNTAIGTLTVGGSTPSQQTCVGTTTNSTGGFSCTFTAPPTAGNNTVFVAGADFGSLPADNASSWVKIFPAAGSGYAVNVAVDSAGGSPLDGATVTLNGISALTGLGDSAGFDLAASGTYTLTATDSGYQPYSGTITVTAPQTTLTVTLQPATSSTAGSGSAPGAFSSGGASSTGSSGSPAASVSFTNSGAAATVDVWFVWYNSNHQVVNIGEQVDVPFSAGQTLSFTGTYYLPGVYTVKVFVTDADSVGLSASYSTTVTVL